MLLARSAPEGEADETGVKADIDTRTSAVEGRADVSATWPESPLLAEAVEKVRTINICATIVPVSRA